MTALYDKRSPTIVIVGYWNVAILNEPAWVARHILEMGENQEVEIKQILVGDGQSAKTIWVFGGFGICCHNNRLEIFETPETTAVILNGLLVKLEKLLPHTPVSAIGFNFQVSIEEEIDALVESLGTSERLDDVGNLLSRQRVDVFDIARDLQIKLRSEYVNPCRLKLERSTDFHKFMVHFNFHHEISAITALAILAETNAIDHWQQFATNTMRDAYNVDGIQNSYF